VLTHFPSYNRALVSELIPYARNARTHSPAQVAQIAASIREFGFTNPILINGERGVIAGHGRLLAARQLSMQEVPTLKLSHLTPA
jgi:ParB-like chromosome segregation protein Spo0J